MEIIAFIRKQGTQVSLLSENKSGQKCKDSIILFHKIGTEPKIPYLTGKQKYTKLQAWRRFREVLQAIDIGTIKIQINEKK